MIKAKLLHARKSGDYSLTTEQGPSCPKIKGEKISSSNRIIYIILLVNASNKGNVIKKKIRSRTPRSNESFPKSIFFLSQS